MSILALLLQKARCYVRRRTGNDGSLLPWEIGAGFTERPLVPLEANTPPEGKANDVLPRPRERPKKNTTPDCVHPDADSHKLRAHLEHHR